MEKILVKRLSLISSNNRYIDLYYLFVHILFSISTFHLSVSMLRFRQLFELDDVFLQFKSDGNFTWRFRHQTHVYRSNIVLYRSCQSKLPGPSSYGIKHNYQPIYLYQGRGFKKSWESFIITPFGLQLFFLIGMRPKTSSQQHSLWYLRVMCQFSVCATTNHRTCRLISPFPDISLFRYSFLTLKLKSNVVFETLNGIHNIIQIACSFILTSKLI